MNLKGGVITYKVNKKVPSYAELSQGFVTGHENAT